MGDVTGIGWTDHTFNPWIGCTKVSPGCANCYAERDNKRYSWVDGWGQGKPRRLTSESNWKKPIQWAKQAVKDGVTRRVFCASLADVFDAEVSNEWRLRLWELIEKTGKIGGLEWLILTKRPENIPDMFPPKLRYAPPNYIRLGVTAETQFYWDKRMRLLLSSWKGKNFVSVEPMLGAVDPTSYAEADWVIVGCESGVNARGMEDIWIDNILRICVEKCIPVFLKQVNKAGTLIKEPYWRGMQYLQFPA